MDTNSVTEAPFKRPPGVQLVGVPGGVPDLDKELRELIAEAGTEKVLRVRLPFTALVEGDESYQYSPLKRMAWIVEFRQPALARDFREGLDAFLRAWCEATAEGRAVVIAIGEKPTV